MQAAASALGPAFDFVDLNLHERLVRVRDAGRPVAEPLEADVFVRLRPRTHPTTVGGGAVSVGRSPERALVRAAPAYLDDADVGTLARREGLAERERVRDDGDRLGLCARGRDVQSPHRRRA